MEKHNSRRLTRPKAPLAATSFSQRSSNSSVSSSHAASKNKKTTPSSHVHSSQSKQHLHLSDISNSGPFTRASCKFNIMLFSFSHFFCYFRVCYGMLQILESNFMPYTFLIFLIFRYILSSWNGYS